MKRALLVILAVVGCSRVTEPGVPLSGIILMTFDWPDTTTCALVNMDDRVWSEVTIVSEWWDAVVPVYQSPPIAVIEGTESWYVFTLYNPKGWAIYGSGSVVNGQHSGAAIWDNCLPTRMGTFTGVPFVVH